MHSDLARVLVIRGVIRQGTIVEAYQNVRGLSCVCNSAIVSRFTIVRARLINGSVVVFDTLGPEQVPQQVQAGQVIQVDGMSIERLALTQNLTLDGAELQPHRRRGRRKKILADRQNI